MVLGATRALGIARDAKPISQPQGSPRQAEGGSQASE